MMMLATDGFGAALIALCDLCTGLFEVDAFVQQTVVVDRFESGKELVADRTFISLPTVFTAVFD